MANKIVKKGRWYVATDVPGLAFEDTLVGRLEKQIWEASDPEIDKILEEYEIPSPSELGKPGSYIQTTPRYLVERNRDKNDVIFIPIGSTECHGPCSNSGFDTFMVTQQLEGVRRYTLKKYNLPTNLALPPINYGAHPYHHLGVPGTVVINQNTMKAFLIDVMLGLWNDGFRKQILVNNHGQFWVIEAAIQELQSKFQLPGIFWAIDWHRAVRKFFRTKDRGGPFETDFIHADEAETSVGLLLFPDMIDMRYAHDAAPKVYIPDGFVDKAVDPYHRPSKWSDQQGHMAIEYKATPEGIVGKATLARAEKAKRAVAACLKFLTLLQEVILKAFPAGKVPPVEEVSFRTAKEMEPFLKRPGSKGWKPVYALPKLVSNYD